MNVVVSPLSTFLNDFSSENPGPIITIFLFSLLVSKKRKFVQMVPVGRTRWTLCLYMVKTLSKSSSTNPRNREH